MRRAITSISYMFFGAAILVFISALLIPLLKESPPSKESDHAQNAKALAESSEPISGSSSTIPMTDEAESAGTPQDQNTVDVAQQNDLSTDKTQSEIATTVESSSPQQINASHEELNSVAETTQLTTSSEQNSTPPSGTEQPKTAASVPPAKFTPSGTTLSEIKEALSDAESGQDDSQTAPTSLLILGEGYYSPGEITPNAKAQSAIDKIIPAIMAKADVNIIVEGHADNLMSDRIDPKVAARLNKTVSLRRAIAVAMMLEEKGVDSDKIIVSGLGDTVPMASNLSEEGRAKNRRVEIKLSPSQR